MAEWQYILASAVDGTVIGEVENARARTLSKPLNRVPTGSITVDTNNPMIASLRGVDQVLMKAYRNGSLMCLGPLVPSYQKVVNDQSKTLLVNFSGVGWRLSRRIIESSKSNTGVTYGPGGSFTDRGGIVKTIIDELNNVTGLPDTGIRVPTPVPTSTVTVGPWYYKNALQAISDLSATLDGFDWQIIPNEPVGDSLGLAIGTFNCAQALGTTRPDLIWEYGDGKLNVASFTETGDFTGALNRAYSLPPAFPDDASQSVLTWNELASPAGFYPPRNASPFVYEEVLASDLATDDMRMRLLQESVKVRKQPRTVVTFQPVVDNGQGLPQYGTDFVEGDIFGFRAVEYGIETINAFMRCYQVDFVIDEEGNETATPTLVSQDS